MNVELPSQLLNLLITSRCIILGEYHIRLQRGIINFLLVLTVEISRYLSTIEVEYLDLYTETE